jgi:hypothetical protein
MPAKTEIIPKNPLPLRGQTLGRQKLYSSTFVGDPISESHESFQSTRGHIEKTQISAL